MSDRPIIFSAPMVRALLDGRKTQMRRILKPQPLKLFEHAFLPSEWAEPGVYLCQGAAVPYGGVAFYTRYENGSLSTGPLSFAVGDRLWVREAWSHTGHGVWSISDARMSLTGKPVYRASDTLDGGAKWWSSIHMPREFSRLTLAVTDVRVQRLQDISEDDCWAEGLEASDFDDDPALGFMAKRMGHTIEDMRPAFALLWNSINGPDAWSANPWVVAITFDVIRANIDAPPAKEAA